MMAEESRFSFCKKCGALTRDGVCQSCGYMEAEVSVPQPATGEYPYYNAVAVPSAVPEKKKGKGALVAILISIVVLAFVALVLVVMYAYNKYGDNSGRSDRDFKGESKLKAGYSDTYDDWEDDWEDDFSGEDDYDVPDDSISDRDYSDLTYIRGSYDVTEENWNEEGQDETLDFYSGPYNVLRDDLSYQISFTEEYYYSEETNSAIITVEYPQVVSGLDECRDQINADFYYEYEYFVEKLYTEEFLPQITSDEDYFGCVVDSYVTYMDEEILSVVFVENIEMALQGESFSGVMLYCRNYDLTTGEIMDNSDTFRLDEEFIAKFRELEAIENDGGYLGGYTDEELLEMLADDELIVIFYTPMGIEVGVNLDEVVTYVMFTDYEQYLN